MSALGALLSARPPEPKAVTNYHRVSWTERDGLPAAQIRAITQDGDGYLWLGTNDGLVRFDGVRFAHWDSLGGPVIPSAGVNVLTAARDGGLWLGFIRTPGLIHVHDTEVTTFYQSDGVPEGTVSSLLEDHDGAIWAGSPHGLSRFRNHRWEPFGAREGLTSSEVDAIYEDSHRNIWVATAAGVFRLREGDRAFAQVSTAHEFRSLVEDDRGVMWGTGRLTLLSPLDQSSKFDQPHTLSGDVLGWRMTKDRQGQFWIGSLGQGLFRVSARENIVAKPANAKLDGSSDVVRAVFRDREGNIWVGTTRSLDRYTETIVTSIPAPSAGINGDLIGVLAVNNDLWVGTSDGLFRRTGDAWRRYGRDDGLPSATVNSLHLDRSGNLLVATDRGVGQFVRERFVAHHNAGMVALRRVSAMASDAQGTLWLSDRDSGLLRLTDGVLTAFDGAPDLRQKSALSVYADQRDRVWIGFSDGSLMLFQQGTVQTYRDAGGVHGGITSIHEDRRGTLWVGTNTGLRRFKDGQFTSVPRSVALPQGTVGVIAEDDDGYLWLGVRSGIIRVSAHELEDVMGDSAQAISYTLYDQSDGVGGDVAMGAGAVTRDRDGSFWFATSGGLAGVNPHNWKQPRLPPVVRVESTVVAERTLEPVPHASLPHSASTLRIDYTALSFAAAAKVRFRYKLEGFDPQWVDAGTRRQAFYTNLSPRSYRFHVAAINDGVESERAAVWDFSIQPRFYQTGWFYGVGLLTTLLTVGGLWRLRSNQIQRRFALVIAERARIAREIHDTLLQSLVGVAIQCGSISRQVDSAPQAAGQRLTQLRKQVEFFIREARQSIWDLRSPTLQATDLSQALAQTGERATSEARIDFGFSVIGTPRRCPAKIEEHLLKIGQEATSNAARHACATKLIMQVKYGDDAVTLRVIDDGCGFEVGGVQADGHWGVSMMKERAHLVGGSVRIVSSPGAGTEVEVVVPLPRETRHLPAAADVIH